MSDNFHAAVLPQPPPAPLRWKRWLKRLGWAVLLIVVGTAAQYALERHKTQKALREALEQLDRDDPGWRLQDLNNARLSLDDARNGALVVQAVGQTLPQRWQGLARKNELLLVPRNERLPDGLLAQLVGELGRHPEAIAQARRLSAFDTGSYPVTYTPDVLSTMLPHLTMLRNIASLLLLDAYHKGQLGDCTGALVSCRAAINAGRTVGDELLFLPQLQRIGCLHEAAPVVDWVLGQGEVADEELLALQVALAQEDQCDLLPRIVRSERAAQSQTFEALVSKRASLAAVDNSSSSWQDGVLGFYIRDNLRREHLKALPLWARQIEIAALPLPLRGPAQEQFRRELAGEKPRLSNIYVKALAKVEVVDRRRHAQLRVLLVALAAERHRLRTGQWPTAPEALSDPCDGKPIRYRRLADGVLIYSCGTDGVDDNGTLSQANRPGTDVGVRLWDVAKRGRPPGTTPVSPPTP